MSPHNPLTAYLSERYPETSAMDFYRELFPSGSLASVEDAKVRNRGTYAGVLVRVWSDIDSEGKSIQKVERHSVLDPLDNIEKVITIDSSFSRNADVKDLLSPVSYAGRRPLLNMAHELFALVFDLDELKVDDSGFPCGLDDLIYQMTDLPGRRPALLPVPTYIVSSGTAFIICLTSRFAFGPTSLSDWRSFDMNSRRGAGTSTLQIFQISLSSNPLSRHFAWLVAPPKAETRLSGLSGRASASPWVT